MTGTPRLRVVTRIAFALLIIFPLPLALRAQNVSDQNPKNTIYTPHWNLLETMKQHLPEYPEAAKEQHVSGKVDLRMLIGFDGSVKDVTVISGDPLLTPSAEAAVRQWHYTPPKRGSDSVQVVARVQIYYIWEGCPDQNTTTSLALVSFREPVTEDLSCGTTFTAAISPGLPEFTFKMIPNPAAPDQYGNPQTVASDIEVFRGNSNQPVQHLSGCDFNDMEPPRRGSQWFSTDDYNFDGYKDIYVMTNWGVTGNRNGCVWLYNPTTGLFDYSKEFSDIAIHDVDASTKILSSIGNSSATDWQQERYVVINNLPVLIWSEKQDSENGILHCEIDEKRNGKMVTVLDANTECPANAPSH
jgi:TonB family protein